jgi:hypothetical protein
LRESFNVETADEEQLRELEILGEDQAQVRSLTEKVIARVRGR